MVKVIVLHLANLGPVYGGRLSTYLRDRGYKISPGSLYPLLHSLEAAELLQSRHRVYEGRARKYYEITVGGKSCLEELRQQVGGIVREVFFQTAPGTKGTPAENPPSM